MAVEPPDADDALPARLARTLVDCPEADLVDWIGDHRAALSVAFLQHLKDNHVTASHILADPVQTDRLTRYALTIAGFIAADEPVALAMAQWMRGIWASFNDMAAAVIYFRAALPIYEAMNDELSVARLLANLVGVLAGVGKNVEAEECYHRARPIFLAQASQEPKYLIYLEQSFGWLLHTWGRYDEALVVHQRALAAATEQKLSISIAEIQVNLALTLAQLGRLGEVEEMLQRNRLIAQQAGERVTVARIDMNLGELYTSLGRPVEALRAFQQATQGFVEMEQGFVLAQQATLLRQLGALPAAYRHYDLARQRIAHYELKPFVAETLTQMAACLRLLGGKNDLKRAAKLLDQAEELWRHLGNAFGFAQVCTERILLALVKEDFVQAQRLLADFPLPADNPHTVAEYRLLRAETGRLADQAAVDRHAIIQDYEQVLTYAVEQGLPWLRRSACSGLGKLLIENDNAKARFWLEEAAALDDQTRQTLTLQELKATFHEQANDLYDDLIRQAFGQQEKERLLLYAWRAKAGAFLDLAYDLQGEAAYTAEQRQQIELLRQQIAALRWSLAKEAAATPTGADYEQSNPELTQLTEQLLDVRRQAQQQQTPVAQLTVEHVPMILANMEADLLLEYVRCGDDLYGICATRQGVQQVLPLSDATTIAELAGNLALTFRGVEKQSPSANNHVSEQRINEAQIYLQHCYQLLVAPFAATLQTLANGSKLLIAPCDLVAMLPFAAFWTGEHYWLAAVELELILSGALLRLPSPTASHHSPAVVVAASTDKAVKVREEAVAVAAQIQPSTVFVDAPVLSYLDALQAPPRYLHIAAHTIHRGDAPFFSGIQLCGEVLSVEHCYDLPLWGCELVTLSGCATAAGLESDASLFAFQSACLLAGAKRVLCSLWSIADGMPGAMLTFFYGRLNAGLAASTALRQTQRHFLADPAYRHPALWAAFTCIRR
jgi:CHAT domain-containing protein